MHQVVCEIVEAYGPIEFDCEWVVRLFLYQGRSNARELKCLSHYVQYVLLLELS
jgi:hypothetical protein